MFRKSNKQRMRLPISGALIGVLATSMLAVPANAEDTPEMCDQIVFPLAATSAEHHFSVTSSEDEDPTGGSFSEGTLRWALDEAKELGGVSVIELAAGLEVRARHTLEIESGVSIRSADPSEPASIVNASGDGSLLLTQPFREVNVAVPVEFRDLTLAGEDASLDRGIALNNVCGLGIFDTTVRDFQNTGVLANGSFAERFQKLEVVNSLFTGILSDDEDYYDRGSALRLSDYGPYAGADRWYGATGEYAIRNSIFEENESAGFYLEGSLANQGDGLAGRLLIDSSSFVGNIGNQRSGGAVSVDDIYFSDEFGSLDEDVSAAVVVVDSLFQNNVGQYSGGLSVKSTYAEFEENQEDPAEISFGNAVSVDRSTFANNHATGYEEVRAAPSAFGDNLNMGVSHHSVIDQTERFNLLNVTNSTFLQAADRQEANIQFNNPAGDITFDHVTLKGNGLRIPYVYEDTRLKLNASAFDTGAKQALVLAGSGHGEGEPELEGLTVSEVTSAYTSAPISVPEGFGRVVASSEEFALGELENDSSGKTPAMIPGADSVLLDKAVMSEFTTDQRELLRPQGEASDIGSIEVAVTEPLENLAVFEIGEDQSAKAGETMKFTVTRENAVQNPWTGEASVDVRTLDGTAIDGTDYIGVDLTLTWAALDTDPKTFEVKTKSVADSSSSSKDFTVVLSNPSEHSQLGERAVATGTITADAVTPPVDPESPDTITPGLEDTPDDGLLVNTGGNPHWGLWLGGVAFMLAGVGALSIRRRLQSNQS